MPVELSIVESVTELETTVVEVILESASAPGPAGPGVPTGGTTGQVLKKASNADLDTAWQNESGGGVTDHGALTGLADDDHTQYHTDARGDARYSQLGHAHAGEDITSGTVADARIAATIARDSEVTSAILASEAGQVRDGDAAGGDLTGTYPNPTIAADAVDANKLRDDAAVDANRSVTTNHIRDGAVTAAKVAADVATQAELDAHEADTTSVHGITDTSALYRSGGADVAVADGGTGASTAAGARTNLDVPSTAEAILDALVDAKGDLIVGTAADTPARLAVGTNGQVLTADSAEAGGVKWAAAAAGSTDGWTEAGETWTYASASTFTVSGDQTAKYSKGTRIKLTQTTVKYFAVVGSSHSAGTTTVTITGGDDYTLANAAITDNFYSYAANPQGYPGWFNYTPTYTGFSTDPSGGVARFNVIGRVCYLQHNRTAGTSNATGFTISLPVNADAGSPLTSAIVVNNGSQAAAPGLAQVTSATTITAFRDYSGLAWTASGSKNSRFDLLYGI